MQIFLKICKTLRSANIEVCINAFECNIKQSEKPLSEVYRIAEFLLVHMKTQSESERKTKMEINPAKPD